MWIPDGLETAPRPRFAQVMPAIVIRPAVESDVPLLLEFIRGLADYERLSHQVTASEETLCESLFARAPAAEALIGCVDGAPAGFAVFFHNFSTFLGRRGLYLEDLFVKPEFRGRGLGSALFRHVARLAVGRACGRFEWAVLDWNQPAINFYQKLGATVMPDWRICRLPGDALRRIGGAGDALA